ncbi:MAG: DUF4446 family protein [Solirubrobacteraceae bacterium]
MISLASAQGIAALVGAGGAAVALIACAVLALEVRRLRGAQRAVLGDHGEQDLVDYAVELEQAFGVLRTYVEDVAQTLDVRLGEAEMRLQGAIAHKALVRYDAYNEMSGRQSLSIALLDDTRSGIVLSSIHHRDQARIYAKQVRDGQSELELSPEEQDALRLALAGGDGDDR